VPDLEREPEIRIERPENPLEPELLGRLRQELERCPDVAFAHLPQVMVEGQQDRPGLVLFVWLTPASLSSLRAALRLVTEAVARVLPSDRFLDVVVLNSAPELLDQVEAAKCLLVERDPDERRRALEAAAENGDSHPEASRGPWWWPF